MSELWPSITVEPYSLESWARYRFEPDRLADERTKFLLWSFVYLKNKPLTYRCILHLAFFAEKKSTNGTMFLLRTEVRSSKFRLRSVTPLVTYLIQRSKRRVARLIFAMVGSQPGQNGIKQKRQTSHPLHWQHEEGVEGKTLTYRVRFELCQGFDELRVGFSVETGKLD